MYRLAPKVLGALAIVKPETVIKWHRAGFRSYWRWKSRRRGGRPTVAPEIRKLIREMSIANSLWGAPRIHGELLGIAAMDMFVVPTISFRLLYGLLIVGHGRRQILWFGVTAHPTAEWIANHKLPAISFVTGTGPMVRSSSEGFDQWAFAIDRRRRALLGKMDMLKG